MADQTKLKADPQNWPVGREPISFNYNQFWAELLLTRDAGEALLYDATLFIGAVTSLAYLVACEAKKAEKEIVRAYDSRVASAKEIEKNG